MSERSVTWLTYILAILLSLVGHVVTIEGLGAAARRAPKKRLRAVEMALFTPPPPPEPVVEEPKPKKPPPPPPKPKSIDLTKVPPPPIEEPPPSNTSESEVPPEEAKPVFGISMSSVVGPGSGSGFSVRVGNTLMKEPEEELTPPEEVKKYAKPVALHKVSRPARRIGDCRSNGYPEEAKALGIEGTVVLRLEVRDDGSVGQIDLVKGLGYGLDQVAIAAMRVCRFEPATVAGDQAVTTIITYRYTFVIED